MQQKSVNEETERKLKSQIPIENKKDIWLRKIDSVHYILQNCPTCLTIIWERLVVDQLNMSLGILLHFTQKKVVLNRLF